MSILLFWIWIALFASVGGAFAFYVLLLFREKKERQATIRQALQLGQPLDKETLVLLSRAPRDEGSELTKALSGLGLGAGFLGASAAFYLGAIGGRDIAVWPLALGLIFIGHSAGRLAGHLFSKNSDK